MPMRPIDPRIQQVGITLDMFLKDDTSTTHFAIVTASKLENIIGGYEASRLATRSFYDHLRAQNRITIIDGLQIFRIVQGSYERWPPCQQKSLYGHQRDGYGMVMSGSELSAVQNSFLYTTKQVTDYFLRIFGIFGVWRCWWRSINRPKNCQ